MKYTRIIWDFNGTILDDVDAGIASVNKLLAARGLPVIDGVESYYKVFGFPIIDYYKRLGFDFEHESYDELAKIWVSEYLKNSEKSGLREGVPELLQRFADDGVKQDILSMTELGMLKKQVDGLGIGKYFTHIYGLDNIHAESKLGLAKLWRKDNPDADALFIGDTLHDADAAAAMGADCILVCGGHQPAHILSAAGCRVVEKISDIIKAI